MDKGKKSLSVAIAAPLRQCVPAFGGHDWDKLSLPHARLKTGSDGQDGVLGDCGEDIRTVDFKGDLGSISMWKGPHGCWI